MSVKLETVPTLNDSECEEVELIALDMRCEYAYLKKGLLDQIPFELVLMIILFFYFPILVENMNLSRKLVIS